MFSWNTPLKVHVSGAWVFLYSCAISEHKHWIKTISRFFFLVMSFLDIAGTYSCARSVSIWHRFVILHLYITTVCPKLSIQEVIGEKLFNFNSRFNKRSALSVLVLWLFLYIVPHFQLTENQFHGWVRPVSSLFCEKLSR